MSNNEKSKSSIYQQTFKDKKEAVGESEIRGSYAKTELHKDIKKVIKCFPKYHAEIMLFIHSLDL